MSLNNFFFKQFSFDTIDSWDVKKYLDNSLLFDNAVFLKDILTYRKKLLSKEIVKENRWQIISKINFSGELFLRDVNEIETYKGNLYEVSSNNIIYSKINVRHGCVFYHEGEMPFAVSSEYPTFEINQNKVDGNYLKLLLRSSAFKELLDTKTSGISKARVKVDEFLNIKIPLPLLEEQIKLVKKYTIKIALAEKQEKEAKEIEESLEIFFNNEIGLEVIEEESNKNTLLKIFNYEDLDTWGVDKLYIQEGIRYTKNYPTKPINTICQVSSGGTPSRSRKEYYGGSIPWVKTGEVVNEVIYDTQEKITEEAIHNSSAKLYKKGSLIIAMYGQGLTRGRTAKLGVDASTNQACAVLSNIDNKLVLTDYLWFYLMNEYHRLRDMASGNSQPNLNAQMIKGYKVVIPPFDIQEKIIEEISSRKEKIKQLLAEALQNREDAIKEFEEEIFTI